MKTASRYTLQSLIGVSNQTTVSRYFSCMDIVRHLQSLGAKPARELIDEAEEYESFEPGQWDSVWIDEMQGDMDGFSAEMQPFYEGHWDLLYELRPDSGPAVFPEPGFAVSALSQ